MFEADRRWGVKGNWTRVLINAELYITMENLGLITRRQKLSAYFLSLFFSLLCISDVLLFVKKHIFKKNFFDASIREAKNVLI